MKQVEHIITPRMPEGLREYPNLTVITLYIDFQLTGSAGNFTGIRQLSETEIERVAHIIAPFHGPLPCYKQWWNKEISCWRLCIGRERK